MPRWTELSLDPNSQIAIESRMATVTAARRPVTTDKLAYIRDLVRGKRVLDVGVVEHFLEAERDERWLHHHVSKSAAYCLGVDILAEPVQKLKAQGYNVAVCDITRDPINDTFDVMICGDVIEHLGAPQGMFDAAAKVLVPGGRMLVATPNPFFLNRAWRIARGRFHESVDHVMHFDASNIAELAERAGLRLDAFRGVAVPVSSYRSFVGRMYARMQNMLPWFGFAPESVCNTVVYECVKG
ncbi:MAG: class I SAM-dependent methyltransferase [Gemmataceae bacterium]|nr:class I SAM-dependent methyltransferase [Gemmataceae bacterium]